MTFQTSNDKMVKNRKRRERRAAERRKNDLKQVMTSVEGRRVIWAVLADAGVYRACFTQPNAMVVSFNEGMRNIGLKMLSELQEVCLDELHLAENEAFRYAKKEAEAEDAIGLDPEKEDDYA